MRSLLLVLLVPLFLLSAGLAAAQPVVSTRTVPDTLTSEVPRFLTGDLVSILGTGLSDGVTKAKPTR